MFVNTDIRKEMYKGADANVDAQFKKLYIYHMENVSILFADIKVSGMNIKVKNEKTLVTYNFKHCSYRVLQNWLAKRRLNNS